MTKLVTLPQLDTNLPDDDRKDKVLELARSVYMLGGKSKMALAACLVEIKDEGYWQDSHQSFDEFVFTEFGYSRSTAASLMQVYTTFVEKLELDPDEISNIQWARLAMIVPSVTSETAQELIEVARTADTQADLRKHLKALQGQHITESTNKGIKFTFPVQEDQREVIKAAISLAEEINDTTIPGLVLECMAADYLIGHQDETSEGHLDRVIDSLERTYNVTIDYVENQEDE